MENLENFDKKEYIAYIKMKEFVNKLNQNCLKICLNDEMPSLNSNDKICLEKCEKNIHTFMLKASKNFEDTNYLFSQHDLKANQDKYLNTTF